MMYVCGSFIISDVIIRVCLKDFTPGFAVLMFYINSLLKMFQVHSCAAIKGATAR